MIELKRSPENHFSVIQPAKEYISNIKTKDIYIENPSEVKVLPSGELLYYRYKIPVSDYGFESICNSLGIPVYYAKKISANLAAANINGLLKERNKDFFIRTQNIPPDKSFYVTSFLNESYCSLKHSRILNFLEEEKIVVKDIWYSPKLLRITLLFEENKIEVSAADIITSGCEITNSENGFSNLTFLPLLYRGLCSNSSILPKRVYSNSYRIYRSYTKFQIRSILESGIENANMNITNLKDPLIIMQDKLIGYIELKKIKRKIGRFFNKKRVEETFNRSSYSYYEVFNIITQIAQEHFSFLKRRNLEVFAGEFFYDFYQQMENFQSILWK